MTKVNVSYTDFSAGEISPKMYGRFDLSVFYSGHKRIENFIIDSVGQASYRNGFHYAAQTAGNNPAFLWKFEYDDSLSFMLEFTAGKIRFYRNDGQVREAGQDVTGVTRANPAVVTYSGDDNYTNGDSVFFDDVVGMTELNGNEYTVANVDTGANTFELLGVDSTSFTAYTSGGTVYKITEVDSPYSSDELFELKFAQNNIDLYIVHPSHPPKKLTFSSATDWAISDHDPIQETFGVIQSITDVTQASPPVVTYTGADNYENGDTIIITGVSGMTELNDERFEIANVNTGTKKFELVGVDATGYTSYSSGGLIREIIENEAVFLTADEYPSAVTFYEDRLIYGGSNNNPQTLYFSRSADPDDFTIGVEVDDGLEYTVSGDGNRVQWLRGTDKFLAIGAFGDVLQATGGIDGVITPESISIRPSNSYGVGDINPLGKNTQIFFTQRNNLVLRSFEFKFEIDSYIPIDRNIISDHITKSGLRQISFQEARPNVVWATRNDGALVGMTLEESEGVSGWHRHNTDGEFVSIASVPRATNDDQLWACVKRNVDGVDKYYIEYKNDNAELPLRTDYVTGDKEADFDKYRNMAFEAQKNYIFLDSCLSYYGDGAGESASAAVTPASNSGVGVTFTSDNAVFSASDVGRQIWAKAVDGTEQGRGVIVSYVSDTEVTCDIIEDFTTLNMAAGEWYLTAGTISRLEHLEGKTVSIIADGGQHAPKTVTNGSITLDRQVSVVHVGLPYTGYIETNSLEGGGTNGTAQTKRKSVISAGIRVLKSLYGKVGTDYYNFEQIYERNASMKMDRPPLPYTGDKKITLPNKVNSGYDGGWQREKNVIISQDQPFPLNVQLIIPYMDVSNV